MTPHLSYVIVFVSNMDLSVAFYRDTLGFKLRFASPGWTEFETGSTVLALHPGEPGTKPPEPLTAATADLGIMVPNLDDFYRDMQTKGVNFTMPPTKQEYGGRLARFLDPDGLSIDLSEPYEAGAH